MTSVKLDNLYDYLKTNAAKIHFFGLGFIQVKLNDEERYHFYSPELAAITPEEEVHDHRYHFKSTVVKGTLDQTFYDVKPYEYGKYQMREVSCDPMIGAPDKTEKVSISTILKTSHAKDSSYQIGPNTFHKVLPVKTNTITHLVRGPRLKNLARVVSSVDEQVCPFSKEMSEEDLWAQVKQIIEE